MDSITIDIPDHVPPELVRDDYRFIMGLTTVENPFDTMTRKIHQGPDIIYSTNAYPIGIPAWIPRRLEDLQAIYLDTEHFSSAGFSPYAMLVGESWNLVPAEIDPPGHTAYRALLTPLFTPVRMKALENKVRQAAREFIGRFRERGECEFMSEFAQRFPIVVFLDLMGMPRERLEQFLEWEHMLLHSMDFGRIIEGTQQVVAYLREIIEERRRNPGDDLVSMAVTAKIDGRALNDDELMGMCFNFYIGGLDTVTTNIAWQIRHLAEHPADQRRLRKNPQLIPVAVEAMYRRYAAVTTFRTCVKQTAIRGLTIMPGDKVAVSTTLANTDPDAWQDPFTLDFDKPPRHMGFGFGIHRCAGAPLARRESVVAIEEMLAALPEFRIADGEELVTDVGPILQPKNLPLCW